MHRFLPRIPTLATFGLALFCLLPTGCNGTDDLAAIPGITVHTGGLEKPASNADLERYIKNGLLHPYGSTARVSFTVFEPTFGFATVQSDAGTAESTSSFSTTNLQEAGVDEADTTKFDGRYLFVAEQPDYYLGWFDILPVPLASMAVDALPLVTPPVATRTTASRVVAPWPGPRAQPRIRVLDTTTTPPSATEVAVITLPLGAGVSGMYLLPAEAASGRPATLATVGHSAPKTRDWSVWTDPWVWQNGRTAVTVLDVTDPSAPTLRHSIELEGHLIESRTVAGVLYVATRYAPYLPGLIRWPNSEEEAEANRTVVNSASLADLLPQRTIDGLAPVAQVSADDCFVPSGIDATSGHPDLVVVTAINLADPTTLNSVCLGAASHGLYGTPDALYLTGSTWNTDSFGSETVIHKFSLSATGPEYRGSGQVPGNLGWRNPRFRLGAAGDYLRVLTTERDFSRNPSISHQLNVLTESATDPFTLQMVATLPNPDRPAPIGKPGEDIFAVRFMGDRGYVVTFRRVDPLYVLDLSDALDPFIAGELMVPGFSDYLHPIGTDLLVGVGQDVTDDPALPATIGGVKVGLFNVADPSNPIALESVVLGTRGSRTQVSQDPHAFAFLPGSGGAPHKLAIPVNLFQQTATEPITSRWARTGLHLFEIAPASTGAPASLTQVGEVVAESASDTVTWPAYWGDDRGVIVDTAVHYVHENQVWSAPWNAPDTAVGPQ
jgi:uncharacterized secreted protein with C-terminal beta-propeller domain